MTKELHCGEAESEVLVFYPWVITKKNHQHHEIKDIHWEEFKRASFLQLFSLKIVNKASDAQMQLQGVVPGALHMGKAKNDGWKSSCVDG